MFPLPTQGTQGWRYLLDSISHYPLLSTVAPAELRPSPDVLQQISRFFLPKDP